MRKFFVKKENNNKVIFSFNDNKHLKVLRTKVNDVISCFDECGNIVDVRIDNINPYSGTIINTVVNTKKPYPITCFLGIIKKNNFELAVEKLNELNIKKIVPVYFAYSQNNIFLNYKRLETIIDASSKQCNRFDKIILEEPIKFSQMIEQLKEYDKTYFAFEKEENKTLSDSNKVEFIKNEIAYIIGPEGGFNNKEIDVLKQNCETIRLTNTILRSETAAIYLGCNLIERFYKNEK